MIKTPIKAAALGALFAVAPLSAQEPEAPAMCMATVDVEAVQVGEAATAVTFALSEAVGEVSAFEGGESGLRLSLSEELDRTDMATEEEAVVIEMSAETPSQATLWLNSVEAQAGTYEVTLIGEAGSCHAEVTIEGGAS